MSIWKDGRLNFESEYILLPEGRADKKFFGKLVKSRQLPKFDIPWPILEKEIAHLPQDGEDRKYQGNMGFKHMLKAIAPRISLRSKARGILIATDAGDNWNKAFNNVCDQIRDAGKFPVPNSPMEVAHGVDGMPSVCVMLIPLDGPGSLETLCVEYFRIHKPEILGAAEKYLTTAPIDISGWGKEKQDKARFQCMIAGTHERNPTLAVQGSFSRSRGIIDLRDPIFDSICDLVSAFCKEVSA